MSEDIKLAYFAGALDGDGSFSLIKGTSSAAISPLYYPMVQFANAKKEIVDLFHAEFGGSLSFRKAYVAKDGFERQPSYQWKLEKSVKCLPFLETIIPYLIIKKERALFLRDYIINNPFIRGSNRLSDSALMNRERAYIKMRSFNDNPDVNGELYSKSKRNDSMDSSFWAYVAGIMDTDGSFSLKKENRTSGGSKSPVYTSTILLTMTDCRAIYYIMNNFVGGNMMIVKAKTATNGFCYRFSITSRKISISFLKRCIPFLTIKKNVAQKLLEFCESFKGSNGRSGISSQELCVREKYYSEVRELNKYGVSKFPLIGLKPLPDNAEGNKAQATKVCSVNVASEETSKLEDAVL